MKKGLLLVLVGCMTMGMVVQQFQIQQLKDNQSRATPIPLEKVESDYAVAGTMIQFQIHMDKLHQAINANNDALIRYLLHEMEEGMEDLVDAKIEESGVDISYNAKMFGLTGVREFRKRYLEEKKDAGILYNKLIQDCNGCHMASKKAFIRIQEPTGSIFSNQVFE